MAFTSVEFIIFLILGVALYYAMPKRIRWVMLLLISYVFYLSGGVGAVSYILFTTISTYIFGLLIGNVKKGDTKEEKQKSKRKRQALAAVVLLLNFGLLYVVKYWNFTMDLANVPGNVLRFNLLMPLGISFYIFTNRHLFFTFHLYFRY